MNCQTGRCVLRLTGQQHADLRQHLFPGDGLEAVAALLCGRRTGTHDHILTAHKIVVIPYDVYTQRTAFRVSWPIEPIIPILKEATKKGMALVKVHSHPGRYERFSEIDDKSDCALFPSLHGWTDNGLPHASAVMLSDGRIFGRFAYESGAFQDIDRVAIAGDDLFFFDRVSQLLHDNEEQVRTRQAFGSKTTQLLKSLRIGVVGCSGTGSWIAEQLTRLGTGRLLLIDPDRIERKNLNRIVGACEQDAQRNSYKVEALRDRLAKYGTGTSIQAMAISALTRAAIYELATCDILFGCMDSIEGRDLLNRVAVFYSIPYFDLGVQLRADGFGGVDTICGSVHFMVPDGSSLLSRRVYTPEMLRAEALSRTNPNKYEQERKDGYVRGVAVGAPAVISVNGFCASMAINELLARLHRFRIDPNSGFRWQQFDLVNSCWQSVATGDQCPTLSKWAGRGDLEPLLNCNLIVT